MSKSASSLVATALGQISYRLALAVIGFGVFMGWLIACAIPLCIYGSYFDDGGPVSTPISWAVSIYIVIVPVALTYRSRKWIASKALEDVSLEPVQFWSREDVVDFGGEIVAFTVGLIGLVTGLAVAVALLYGGYLLMTSLSVPSAVLAGATIIALAILIAACA